MAGLKETILERARRGLNSLQERVTEFESEGGLSSLVDRVSDRARLEEERLASGRHPLNPEYRVQVRQWYARLEVQPGASVEEVRRAFRGLMRRYHPDRYTADGDHEELATRLSQELTVAYEGILEYLGER